MRQGSQRPNLANREPSVAAYEVAYLDAYADALPAPVATSLTPRCKVLDPGCVET
jgi:hypothetical protein